MATLLYASLLFALAFVLHLIMWRIYLPKRQAKVVFLLFVGVLCCGSFVFWKYDMKISIFAFRPPGDLAQFLQVWICYLSLTLAYMITYSAIEADSPSLIIIMKIAKAGTSGLTREALEGSMGDDILVEPRLKDLVTDKMADVREGTYRLKMKGLMIAQLFTFYRNIMNVGKGG